MTIRQKLISGLCLLLFLLGVGMLVTTHIFVLPAVRQIELSDRYVDLERAQKVIEQELNRIKQLSLDWGQWDDTYRFIDTPYPEYISSNLVLSTLEELDMHMLLLIDEQYNVVTSLVSPPAQSLERDIRQQLQTQRLVGHLSQQNGTGLLLIGSQLVLVGASAILPSNLDGPPKGRLYFIRMVDDAIAALLTAQLQIPSRFAITGRVQANNVHLANDNLSISSLTIRVLNTDAAMQITLEQDRPFYQQAYKSLVYLMLTIFSIGLAATVIVYVFLQRTLINPILTLKHQSEQFGQFGHFRTMEFDRRSDELGQLHYAFSQMAQRVQHNRRELLVQRDQFEQASLHDPLTQLGNRRYLEQSLSQAQFYAQDQLVLIAVVDLDNFKYINDQYGHDAGDSVLKQLSSVLKAACPPDCILSRTGGEEFTLLTPVMTATAAQNQIERIRQHTAEFTFDHISQRQITCSLGFVLCPPSFLPHYSDCWLKLFKLADLALYEAKRAGRNTWVGYYFASLDTALPLPQSEVAIHQALEQHFAQKLQPDLVT